MPFLTEPNVTTRNVLRLQRDATCQLVSRCLVSLTNSYLVRVGLGTRRRDATLPPDTCSPDTSSIHLYPDTSCSFGIFYPATYMYDVSGANAALDRYLWLYFFKFVNIRDVRHGMRIFSKILCFSLLWPCTTFGVLFTTVKLIESSLNCGDGKFILRLRKLN